MDWRVLIDELMKMTFKYDLFHHLRRRLRSLLGRGKDYFNALARTKPDDLKHLPSLEICFQELRLVYESVKFTKCGVRIRKWGRRSAVGIKHTSVQSCPLADASPHSASHLPNGATWIVSVFSM